MPVCIKLIDEPHRLQVFLQQHQSLLKGVHTILENTQTYQLIARD